MSNKMSKEMRSILQRCENHLSDYVDLLNGLREDEETGDSDLDKLSDEICLILHGKEEV